MNQMRLPKQTPIEMLLLKLGYTDAQTEAILAERGDWLSDETDHGQKPLIAALSAKIPAAREKSLTADVVELMTRQYLAINNNLVGGHLKLFLFDRLVDHTSCSAELAAPCISEMDKTIDQLVSACTRETPKPASRDTAVEHASLTILSAVRLAARARRQAPAFGDALLRYLRTWQALGDMPGKWLEDQRQIALFQYAGVDNGFLATYDRAKARQQASPDDPKALKAFLSVAEPMLTVLAEEGHLDNAVQIYADIHAATPNQPAVRKRLWILLARCIRDFTRQRSEPSHVVRLIAALKEVLPAEAQEQVAVLEMQLAVDQIIAAAVSNDFKTATQLLESFNAMDIGMPEVFQDLLWGIDHALKAIEQKIKTATATSDLPKHLREKLHILFGVVLRLKPFTQPQLVHSVILGRATRLAPVYTGYLAFLRLWDLETLRAEDFERQPRKNGKSSFPSLAEQIAVAIYKAMKKRKKRSSMEAKGSPAHLFMESRSNSPCQQIDQSTFDDIFRPMNEANRELSQHSISHASTLADQEVTRAIIPVNSEPTLKEGDANCTAPQNAVLRDFLKSIMERYPDNDIYAYYYAKLLLAGNRHQEAFDVLIKSAKGFSDQYWFWACLAEAAKPSDPELSFCCLCKAKLDADMNAVKPLYLKTFSKGFTAALKKRGISDGDPVIRQFANQAEAHILDDVEWADASVVEVTPMGEPVTAVSVLAVFIPDNEPTLATGSAPSDEFGSIRRGDPLSIRVVKNKRGWQIIAVKQRDGQPWDSLPDQVAVVTNIRRARQLVTLQCQDDVEITVSCKMWRQAKDWKVGDKVRIKTILEHDTPIIVCSKPESKFPDFAKNNDSTVEKIASDGSVRLADDVQIPRGLAISAGLKAGQSVSYIAVKSTHNNTLIAISIN